MQVVINKCFLPNLEKNLAQIQLVVFKKNAPLIKEMTSPNRRLGYKMVSGNLKLTLNLLTAF